MSKTCLVVLEEWHVLHRQFSSLEAFVLHNYISMCSMLHRLANIDTWTSHFES